jgi:hypothetical protein
MPVVTRENWHVNYHWSQSSGLKLGTCDYQGIRVLRDASVPFVYVKYEGDSSGPFTDELQSLSTSIEVREIMFGFDLKVVYDSYGADYQYAHVWRFLHDGQFGSKIIIHGPGEEIDGRHVYHIPFRFDLDVSGAGADSFEKRSASGRWSAVSREGQFKPVGPPGTFEWRVIDHADRKAAHIRPGLTDDDAELWALRYRRSESWSSFGGAEEGPPGSPGSVPAIYATGESVKESDVVLWYIAHVTSVDLPRACGPWFHLQGFPPPEDDDDGGDHHHDHH